MTLLRITLFLAIAQSMLATAALAGDPVPSPIPEPASLLLLAVGLGGVAVARKLRRRK